MKFGYGGSKGKGRQIGNRRKGTSRVRLDDLSYLQSQVIVSRARAVGFSYLPPGAADLLYGWRCRRCKVEEEGMGKDEARRRLRAHLHIYKDRS
jgi:hypothetical protein